MTEAHLRNLIRAFCHYWHGSGSWIINTMTHFAKEIFSFVCDQIRRGHPSPSINRIAKHAKCGRTSAILALIGLRATGWLSWTPQYSTASAEMPPLRLPNLYEVMIPDDHEPRPDRLVLTRKQQIAKRAAEFLEQRRFQIARRRWNDKYGIDLAVSGARAPAVGPNAPFFTPRELTLPDGVFSPPALSTVSGQHLNNNNKARPIFAYRRRK